MVCVRRFLAAAACAVMAAAVRDDNMGRITTDAAGVSETLATLTAELQQQIRLQEKSMTDAMDVRLRKESEKTLKQKELRDIDHWYKVQYWEIFNEKKQTLRAEIQQLGSEIAELEALEQEKSDAVSRMTSDLTVKRTAKELAGSLEQTVAELTTQIDAQQRMLEQEAEDARTKETAAAAQGKAKVEALDASLKTLAASVSSVEAERALLLEEHTEQLCSAKESKAERICSRCASGTAACGDECLEAGSECHHDVGCACNEAESSSVLLQLGTQHPLREKIEAAKAAVRKAIAQHEATVQSLQGDVALNEETLRGTERRKADSLQEYDEAIAQLDENIAADRDARAAATESRKQALAQLEKVGSDGEAAKTELAAQLQSSLEALRQEMANVEQARTNQLLANKELMEALLDAHAVAHNQLAQEIEGLRRDRKEAQDTLQGIASEHLID